MQFSLYFFFWKIHDTASEKNICQCFHLCRNVEFSFCHKWKQSKCHSRVIVWILEHFYSNYKQPLKVFCKKGALRKFKKFRQSTCARVSFLIRPATLLKKRLWHWCFPVNFVWNFQEHLFHRTTLDDCFFFSLYKYLWQGICWNWLYQRRLNGVKHTVCGFF